jgi:predicted hydrolase (HD superfamily)
MMPRREALRLVKDCSKRSHLLASELMERLAAKLGEDRLEWGLVGLLHDLDFDEVRNDMSKHGVVAAERLRNKLPEHCLHAIKAHDYRTEFKPKSRLDKALVAVDSLAVLVEKAQVRFKEPDAQDLKKELKKLSSTEPWHRNNIQKCRELGLDEDDFFRLALKAERPKI